MWRKKTKAKGHTKYATERMFGFYLAIQREGTQFNSSAFCSPLSLRFDSKPSSRRWKFSIKTFIQSHPVSQDRPHIFIQITQLTSVLSYFRHLLSKLKASLWQIRFFNACTIWWMQDIGSSTKRTTTIRSWSSTIENVYFFLAFCCCTRCGASAFFSLNTEKKGRMKKKKYYEFCCCIE